MRSSLLTGLSAFVAAAAILSLSPHAGFGQTSGTGIIVGSVSNESTRKVLERATVTVAGTNLSALTAADGSFRLVGVPAGAHTLQIGYAGLAGSVMKFISILFLGALGLMVRGVEASTAAVPAAIVRSEFVNDRASYPECRASTVVELAPGRLAAAWFGGRKVRNPDVGVWFARQEAGRWRTAVEVANGVPASGPRMPTWNPAVIQTADGRVHVTSTWNWKMIKPVVLDPANLEARN